MAEEPDRLRRDIEDTRASLTRDVDLLAEKTSPKKVAQRRWTAVKEKVMGSSEQARYVASDKAGTLQDKASSAAGAVQDKAGDVADTVRAAPQAVVLQTKGNPIAAGIIAFGVGMLAATLIPVTDAERQAGRQLKERSGDLTDQVKGVASDVKEDLQGTVRQAAEQVKETARDAAHTTRDQAQSSARDAREQTRRAASNAS